MHHGCLFGGALFLLAVGKFVFLFMAVVITFVPTLFVAKELGEWLRDELHKQKLEITGRKAQ